MGKNFQLSDANLISILEDFSFVLMTFSLDKNVSILINLFRIISEIQIKLSNLHEIA